MSKYSKLRIGNRDEIYSPSIDAKGYLNNKHGISLEVEYAESNYHSFPLWWKKINGAKSYAIVLESYDSNKVIGVPFINWVAVNIKENELFDNQSLLDYIKWKGSNQTEFSNDILWQGYNSTHRLIKQRKNSKSESDGYESCRYLGPIPAFDDSIYVLRVFGLDVDASELEYIEDFSTMNKEKLNKPYYIGDMLQAISNAIVGNWTMAFRYKRDEQEKVTAFYKKVLEIK